MWLALNVVYKLMSVECHIYTYFMQEKWQCATNGARQQATIGKVYILSTIAAVTLQKQANLKNAVLNKLKHLQTNIVKISSLAAIRRINQMKHLTTVMTDACVEAGGTDLLNADRGSSGERRHIPSCSLIPCHNSAAAVPAIVSHHVLSSRPAAVAYTCRPLDIFQEHALHSSI